MKKTTTGPKLAEINTLLQKIPIPQLEAMANIYQKKQFQKAEMIGKWLIDNEKNYVFQLGEEDTHLNVKKAFSRGKAGGVSIFLQLFRYANWELDRRLTKGKEKVE